MVEFVCVRCYSCGSVQSQQRSKQRQWTCKLCHAKQTLQRVLACSSNGADIQRFVMQCNMQAAQTEMREAQEAREANQAGNEGDGETDESDSASDAPHKRPRLSPHDDGSSQSGGGEFGQPSAPAPQPIDWSGVWAGEEESDGGSGGPAQRSSLWAAGHGPFSLAHPSTPSSSALSAASRRELAFTAEPPKQAVRRSGPHAGNLSTLQRQAPQQKRPRAQVNQRAGSSSTRPTGSFARPSSISLQSLPRSFPAAAAAPSAVRSSHPSSSSSSSSRWGSLFHEDDDEAVATAVAASASVAATATANAPTVTHPPFFAGQRGQPSWAAHTAASHAAASALTSAPLRPAVAAASALTSAAAASTHAHFSRMSAAPSAPMPRFSAAPPALPPSAQQQRGLARPPPLPQPIASRLPAAAPTSTAQPAITFAGSFAARPSVAHAPAAAASAAPAAAFSGSRALSMFLAEASSYERETIPTKAHTKPTPAHTGWGAMFNEEE